MAQLHHVIVPSTDHLEAAGFLAMLFGAEPEPATYRYPWSPSLRVGGMKLMFCEAPRVPLHLAFHVTPQEFDAIVGRIREHGVTHGDNPQHPDNSALRADDRGYRAVWALSPDQTLLEFFSFDVLPEGFTSPAAPVG